MARARGDKEYVLPFKGLNSEANLLHFPNEFSPDLLNMEVDFNPQMVRPRKGITKSSNQLFVETRNTSDHAVAIQSFLWEGVGGESDLDFIVVQVANSLFFFDASGLSNPSTAAHTATYDLDNALSGTTKGTAALLAPTRVVMANVKGNLVVTSEQIDPVVIQWTGTALDITLLELKIRDTLGIEDGLEIDERPSSATDDHTYNLLNQGWYKSRRLTAGSSTFSDPIAAFASAFSAQPSNADIPWLGMVEDAGDLIFDPEWLADQTFGSTPSARGHFVIDAFNIDRATILSTPTSSGVTSGGSYRRGGGGGLGTGGGTNSSDNPLPVE